MNTASRGFNEVGRESKRHADLEGEINDGFLDRNRQALNTFETCRESPILSLKCSG